MRAPLTTSEFSTFNEKPLHAALKAWYARPGDILEAEVDGYIIDILQHQKLVEVQTQNFSAIKNKLKNLAIRHPVMLVYPIPKEKWILKLPANGIKAPQRRKSPKRGHVADVFWELVSFPDLLKSPNFSLEVLMTQEEEVRRYVGRGRWKNRGWAVQERRLLGVLERHLFDAPESFMGLLPPRLPDQFTTRELAEAMGATRRFAQRVAYCIREMGLIHQVGKRGRSNLYSRTAMDSEL